MPMLEKLGKIHVGIIGVGGLGSNVAMMLVRSGLRNLTLVDNDVVEDSNLNRQIYFPEDIGKLKVKALSRYLLMLEPNLAIKQYCETASKENVSSLLKGCDVVVEAVDQAEYKTMFYEIFSSGHDCFYVTASGLGGLGRDESPMTVRYIKPNVVCVGDFTSQVDVNNPPLAPRVLQAAALQANVVLKFIISDKKKQ